MSTIQQRKTRAKAIAGAIIAADKSNALTCDACEPVTMDDGKTQGRVAYQRGARVAFYEDYPTSNTYALLDDAGTIRAYSGAEYSAYVNACECMTMCADAAKSGAFDAAQNLYNAAIEAARGISEKTFMYNDFRRVADIAEKEAREYGFSPEYTGERADYFATPFDDDTSEQGEPENSEPAGVVNARNIEQHIVAIQGLYQAAYSMDFYRTTNKDGSTANVWAVAPENDKAMNANKNRWTWSSKRGAWWTKPGANEAHKADLLPVKNRKDRRKSA